MTDITPGEPDEFARLLAQLNGNPEQTADEPVAPSPFTPPPFSPPPSPPAAAPSVPVQAPPVFTPPPAPAIPSPAMPAQAMPAPAMPAPSMPDPGISSPVTPAAPQAAVAPAFGVTAPYPSGSGVAAASAPNSFPPVAPLPDPGPPVAPPMPRAPELMGADELAAPPRSVPPLNEPPPAEPPLAGPPPAGQPTPGLTPDVEAPAFGEAPGMQPPQSFSPPPSTAGPMPTIASTPPSAPPVQAAAPASAAPAPASAAPAPAPRAPLDFASLLTTSVAADDDARGAAAPLSFASGQADDDDGSDLARSTMGEKIGLVLAILVAPIGLIVGIVAAVRSANRRGWVVSIVRASIAIAVVLTVVLGIAGYYGYSQFKVQQAHDQTAAASAAFCAAIKAEPSMAQLPTLGWPAVGASIPDSLKTMQAYEDRFTKLAKVSPAGIKPGATRVATEAKKIIDAVKVAHTIDDATNVATMSAVATSSGVPEWHSTYCG